MTFLLYLLSQLYKERAIIFSSQESYLFYKKIDSISKQFEQFREIKNYINTFHLKENWAETKQKYGYGFLLQELQNLIVNSEEKVIVFHRLGDFFDFQDRYEIKNFYKSLVRTAETNSKKIIFLVNNKNENFQHIYEIAEEFSDVAISISTNEKNERILNIKDILHHREYPLMRFKINENNFLLEYLHEIKNKNEKTTTNILVAELDKAHDNIVQIFSYIFNRDGFSTKYADSLQSILQEIFVKPDIIIVLMKRNKKNLETIKAIKKQLPTSRIVTILDQKFIRGEDVHDIYNHGSDDVFANNFSFDQIILSLQKATKTFFYTKLVDKISNTNNLLRSLDEYKQLANECIENSIFFTAFILESEREFKKLSKTSRKSDFIYQNKNKIYYLAINTMPKNIFIIIENFKETNPDAKLTCIWEPINSASFEESIK